MHLALTLELGSTASVSGPTPASVSEKSLFDAILQGDERAAGAVSCRLLPVVEATLERIFGSRPRAHDALVRSSLARVIFEVARHPHPWVCQLSAWASGLTGLVALEALRARESTCSSDVAAGRTEGAPGARIEQLRKMIAELRPRQAEVIVLHDVLGLPTTQVAITLGVSLETVKSRLSLGRERLAARLARPAKADASRVVALAP